VSGKPHGTGAVTLALTNTGSRSAHLVVYSYPAGPELAGEPRHVDVLGPLSVEVPVVGGTFDVAVAGPNGFRYELAGTTSGAAAGVDASVSEGRRRGDVVLALTNTGSAAVTLTLTSLHYVRHAQTEVLRPGASALVPWPGSKGWYDVELTSAGDATFRRRMTGRMENGGAGVTG